MEPSVNFATIYRPSTFAEVVGQEIPKSVLKKIAAADGISARAIFLKGAWGSGKCVLGDTRVAVSDGYKRISELFDGNEGFNDFVTDVVTRQGSFKSSHWYKEKNCLVRKLTLSNNYVINGTHDHRVLAYKNGTVDLHRIGDLSIGDTILFPKSAIGGTWSHIPQKAYLTGLWLGDGYCSKGKMWFVGTHALCKKFAELAGWSGKLIQDKRRDDLWVVGKLKGDESLIDLSGDSNSKSIPEYIFCSDIESRIEFIRGLLETDGTITSKGDVDFIMNSKQLITQLQELLYTLGVSAHLSTKVAKCGEYQNLVWRLRIPASQSGSFILSKNGRIWSHKDSMNDRNIIHVDGENISALIRAHREACPNRKKSDYGYRLLSNIRKYNAVTERSLVKYKIHYGSLPTELEQLIGFNFETVKEIHEVADDVYDLSVPEVHEFYCQGTFNHNTTLCRIFAKAMNCESFKQNGDVCNECASCKEASAKNSQLYYEFDSSVVGNVDAIRNLQDQFAYIPDGRRVVVFDEIHAASKAALNAMLKMVEDGVPNTIFVFASTEDILPTIKSRSICLEITPIPHELMKERLQQICNERGINITSSDLDQICIKSEGHMRDALSILQLYSLVGAEGIKSSYSLVVKFFKAALSKKFDVADSLLKEILKYNIVDIKNSLYLFIRNCYTSSSSDSLYAFLQTGVINKIFGYFFSPVQQAALQDEVGLEIAFRSFLSKLNKV